MTPLPCSAERWPAFSQLLDQALALPAAERPAWLAALPPEHADLHDALAGVLHSAAAPDTGFLQAPRLPTATGREGLAAGQRVGPYALLRPLGRGGMGEVWLARRADGAFEREVALKLPHAHLLVGALRERFDRERDILAGLSHAHIARFHDAGLADDGQPYLALEVVHGAPLTDWCRSQGLPLAGRLALFDQVLQAVMHAHARLVAHRDLKPANVLVTAEGQVKLLDFGIAKLLHDDGGHGALTQVQGVMATPQYAAPEQLHGGPVSVATDVYALGLMLYELLTDQAAPRAAASAEAVGAEPPQASRAVADPARHRALAGDLDAIVHKALQPLPDDRYRSVAELADDLDRHRRHLPIAARRLPAWHRAARFLRRHRLPAALSAAMVLALLAGTAGIVWQGLEARAQARRAEAVKDFLLGIFSAADPRLPAERPGGQTPAKALLDRAVARIDERFAGDPELRIELLRSAAEIYRELDERTAYRSLKARHVALTRERHGPLDARVLQAELDEIADAWEQDARFDRCRDMLQALDGRITRAGLDRSELRAAWWVSDSICRRDQAGQAARRLDALAQALALYEQLAPGRRGHVTAQAEQATELQSQMRYAEAARAGQRAIALAERAPDGNVAELQTLYGNLGLAHLSSGELMAAAAAFGRAVEQAGRSSGIDARKAWLPRSRQARALHLAGERDAARPLFDALAAALPPPAQPDSDAGAAREDIGERLAAEGRPAQALPELQHAERVYLQLSTYEFALRRVRRHLGDTLDRLGRHDEARRLLLQSLQDYEARGQRGSQPNVAILERWGRFLLDQGDVAAAQVQFQRVVDEAADARWTHVALAQAGLARARLAQDDVAGALQHAQQALDTWARKVGFFDVRMQAYLWRVQAACLQRAGRGAQAQELRGRALAQAERTDAPESPTRTRPDDVRY